MTVNRHTYELIVISQASICLPEALLVGDGWQVPQGLVAPVVQLGHAGPGPPLQPAMHTPQCSHQKGVHRGKLTEINTKHNSGQGRVLQGMAGQQKAR